MAPLLLYNVVLNFGHIFSPHSLIQSSSLPLDHKAPTNLLQPAQCWVSQVNSFQVFSASFIHSAQWFTSSPFPGGVLFQSDTWKTIPVHVENMTKPSPSSLLPLINNVVDVGAFSDVLVCQQLFPTSIQSTYSLPQKYKQTQFEMQKYFVYKGTLLKCQSLPCCKLWLPPLQDSANLSDQ